MRYKQDTFEHFLQDYFMDLREIGGMPITKDNFEDLYEGWLENKQIDDLIALGELYGQQQYLAALDFSLNKLNNSHEKSRPILSEPTRLKR